MKCRRERPAKCRQERPGERAARCRHEWPVRRTTRVREDYLAYLGTVRNLSPHTLESYGKDLEKYMQYLGTRKIAPEQAGIADARGFVSWLTREGLSPRSVNRMVSGV